MNLETKITIYKFTPQVFTLTLRFCYQVMTCCMGFAKFSSAVQMTNFVLR